MSSSFFFFLQFPNVKKIENLKQYSATKIYVSHICNLKISGCTIKNIKTDRWA